MSSTESSGSWLATVHYLKQAVHQTPFDYAAGLMLRAIYQDRYQSKQLNFPIRVDSCF